MVFAQTNGLSCAKNPIGLFNGQRKLLFGTAFCVWEWQQRKGGPKVTCPPWICLVSRGFSPLKFLSGQFVTFLPNFMRTSEKEIFELRGMPRCWYVSKLKLQTFVLSYNLLGFCKYFCSKNSHNCLYPMFITDINPFSVIVVICLNTFSMDTFCDLWCMYGIFIHLVGTPMPHHIIPHRSQVLIKI